MAFFQRQRSGRTLNRAVLDEFEAAIAGNSDPRALRTTVTERLAELARCEEVRLHEVDPSPLEPRPVFARESRLIQWLEVNAESLPIPDDAGVFEYLGAEEQQALSTAHARLCLPILGATHLWGLFLFCDHQPRRTWKRADIATLMACARYAGDLFVAADRQQAEDQRLRTLHRAQQLVVAGQMAAGVAHEVRNPLSTIRSTIQYVLASNSDWPHKLSLLRDALHEVDRIDQAVSGMLNVSRPTTPTMVDTDLTIIVSDALKLVRGSADARDVEFRVLAADRLTVHADAKELRQVFVNLLLNACQAQPAGGLVEVASHTVAASSGTARQAAVRISDRGPGIPVGLLERVFDPFYTSKPNGTGLGLPICREIVARHGGHLDLHCPGVGTIATVLLPLKEVG